MSDSKIFIPEFTPFKHTLYIDVDCLSLQDITPLLDRCIAGDDYFAASLMGSGKKTDTIEYSTWATNETIWDWFKLKEDAILPAFQSTLMYFRKCKESYFFFRDLKENFKFPIEKLKEKWGGTLPDELIFSGTAAQYGILSDLKDAVFFGHSFSPLTYSELAEKYSFLTLYGNGVGITKTKIRYIQWYDRLMNNITNGNHIYKSQYILTDKHANKRK